MPTFETPDGPTTIPLKAQIVKGQTLYAGQAAFTVTNKSGQAVTAHLSAVPQGSAKADWLQTQGEPERDFTGNQTQKVVVNITTPPATPPGTYSFYECVSNNNDRDNDYTNSAVVTFTVPAPVAAKPGIPWWVWLIVGGVVLVIAIVLAIFLWPSSKITVPNVSTGQITYTVAAQQIGAVGLQAVEADVTSTTVTAGNVISQNPAAGTEVDKNAQVTLSVAKAPDAPPTPTAAPTFAVPDVASQGYSADHAKGVLDANGFTYTAQNVAPQGKPPGTVIGESPAAGTMVTADQKSVVLSIDPGIAVPNVVGWMLSTASNTVNPNFQVVVGTQADGGTNDQIVSQVPAPGTVVAKGSKLALTVHGPKCISFKCYVVLQPIEMHEATMSAQKMQMIKK